MAGYIRWTFSEQCKLAAAVVDMVGIDDEVDSSATFLKYVRAAQKEVLESSRRREIQTVAHIKGVLECINSEVQARRAARAQEANAKQEQASGQRELTSADNLETAILALLDSPLCDRLLDKLADRLATRLSQPANAPAEVTLVKHNPNPVEVPRPRLLTVGVIGLLPEQTKILQSSFDDINFKFYERRLPKQLPLVDYMIGMVGFMRHSTDGQAITAYNDRYVRISHGTTQLHNKIRQLKNTFPISLGAKT